MTWAEFKQGVKAAGVMDADVLAYIDWPSGYNDGHVGAFRFEAPDARVGQIAIDGDNGTIERELVDG